MIRTTTHRSRSAALLGVLSLLGASGCGNVTMNTAAPVAPPDSRSTPDPGMPKVAVGEVKASETMELPFILWGGDVATFHANGGLETKDGSLFAKHGLKLKLTPGDDFAGQVKAYMSGKTPFLRGTVSMLGQALDVLNSDPRTKPVVFLQLTWSAGDHMVSRADLKTLNDLKPQDGKKKTVTLQRRGPHVGMLGDILRTAGLSWSDINIVWTDDVTGPKGPAAKFREDNGIDACFAITPDMLGLTGGLDDTGNGEKGTLKDAHVLVSTAVMSRSIADVFACRKDFFDAQKPLVTKLAAAYLKGCEELLDIKRRAADKDKPDAKATAEYQAVLKMTKDIYGKEAIPTEADADGLISDAAFVGLPGNVSFFTEKGNLSNFEGKQKVALDIAAELGDAKTRSAMLKPDFDYDQLKKIGDLTGKSSRPKISGSAKFLPENTIYSFTISFQPNQSAFSESQYGQDFQRALEQASLFGKAGVSIRGHADPTKLINDFISYGLKNGIIQRDPGGNELPLANGKTLTLDNDRQLVQMIETEDLGGPINRNLKEGVQALGELSKERAAKVRQSVMTYAGGKGIVLDEGQIRSEGVGILEPAVPRPKSEKQLQMNRRVEFRIVKVSLEATEPGFEY